MGIYFFPPVFSLFDELFTDLDLCWPEVDKKERLDVKADTISIVRSAVWYPFAERCSERDPIDSRRETQHGVAALNNAEIPGQWQRHPRRPVSASLRDLSWLSSCFPVAQT